MSGFERVGRVEDIPSLEGRAVTVAGRRIAVIRLASGFVAIDGACPHRGGPLADGIVGDSCVTCPLHGWRFDLRTGAPVGGGAASGVRTYEVLERDGELYVSVPAEGIEAA
ncbi:MAG: Rieske 2Fe-2S domain-containing protein [Thermoleophilaceae bacterium]